MSQKPAAQKRSPAYFLFLLTLLGIGAVATAGLVLGRRQPPLGGTEPPLASDPPSKEQKEYAAKYLKSWPPNHKPELVIFFTGQQHNYEAPCGCTEPQFGGLERRGNFFKQIRDLGYPTAAFDLGDIYYPGKLNEQAKLKYITSMKALSMLNYDAIAIGQGEFRVPLIDALANTVLQFDPSYAILGANIQNKDDFPGLKGPMIEDFRVVEPKGSKLKVGVIGTIGDSVIEEVEKIAAGIKFAGNPTVIPAVLNTMNAKNPDLRILLYQGSLEQAKVLAEKINEFDVIFCRSNESEPPSQPTEVKGKKKVTKIVQIGHKGRYVGVLGVFRDANGNFDLKWDAVALDPSFKSEREKQAEHPIVKLLEEYTKELKDKDFLSKYKQVAHPNQAVNPNRNLHYVGSNRCKECHKDDYEIWDESRHAGAFETLSEHPKAKPPHNRKFDGECVVCHTTGFGYQTGYRDEMRTPHLKGVGCETCHGPGSLHADDPKNAVHQMEMSPWKTNKNDLLTARAIKENKTKDEEKAIPAQEKLIADRVFRLCFQCHDTDNDHDFTLEKRWKTIAHGQSVKKKEK